MMSLDRKQEVCASIAALDIRQSASCLCRTQNGGSPRSEVCTRAPSRKPQEWPLSTAPVWRGCFVHLEKHEGGGLARPFLWHLAAKTASPCSVCGQQAASITKIRASSHGAACSMLPGCTRHTQR